MILKLSLCVENPTLGPDECLVWTTHTHRVSTKQQASNAREDFTQNKSTPILLSSSAVILFGLRCFLPSLEVTKGQHVVLLDQNVQFSDVTGTVSVIFDH